MEHIRNDYDHKGDRSPVFRYSIYYVIGTAITERFKNRIKRNVAFHIIIGFIVYQIIFRVCAIPLFG